MPAIETVTNQVPALPDINRYLADDALQDAVAAEGAGHAGDRLAAIGAALGDAGLPDLARQADQYPPVWTSFDPRGRRVDRIDFHPAWHRLMDGIVERGFHASPWDEGAGPRAHTIRAAGYLMQAQVEHGTLCPTTMTYGAVPALRQAGSRGERWIARIRSRRYDPSDRPVDSKHGALIGMGMTEKQGGSDVRANTTRAVVDGDGYRLDGHKWFYSAPQCDAHLVLAYATDAAGREEGLTCFLVPRFAPDGAKNAVHVQRLKDKVGNRSNASAEVEFHGAWAEPVGEPGRGIPTILEMATFTRLDCVIGSAGMMREAVTRAIHHARHRSAFGKPLVDQPLMRSVLADLALESEAATALALRLARAFDGDGESETLFRRLVTSAAKFWVCKRGPELAAEAMEVLGGNGYVEENALARIYREMPVNSIWEGSGNVMCLDVLRTLGRSPHAADVLIAELDPARGRNAAFDRAYADFGDRLAARAFDESSARGLARRIVTLVQAASLLRSPRPVAAEAFCETRFRTGGGWGAVHGEVGLGEARRLIDRAWSATG